MEGIKNFFRRTWNKAQDKAVMAAVRANSALTEMKQEEKGATDMVTIVVIIVIVLALAIIFRDQLSRIFKAVGDKVMSWIQG